MLTGVPIFEVVTGQILLGRKEDFIRLHRDNLLPMLKQAGVEPTLCLLTEIGRFDRFIDIFRYANLQEYALRTDAFLQNEGIQQYYSQICHCVTGYIQVELAVEFPHLSGHPPPVFPT